MKSIFILIFIVASAGVSPAQIPKADFAALVNVLNKYFQQGTVDYQTNTIKNLNDKMNYQMTWLQSLINSRQAKYNSDKSALDALMQKAKGETGSKASNDQSSIATLKKDLEKQNKVISDCNKNLAAEQGIHNELQTLTTDITKANKDKKDKIIADLNKFGATLIYPLE